MTKSKTNNDKIWVKDACLNLRQTSGVEFRGRYMTKAEAEAFYARRQRAREMSENA